MKEKLKALQGLLIGIIFFIPLILLIITFISGIEWYWNNIMNSNILHYIFWGTLILFVIGLFLAFIKPARFVGSTIMFITSYVFGAITWLFSLGIAWALWGLISVIIGLFIAGVGVLPVAILASIFTGNWSFLLIFLVLIISFIVPRILAYYFAEKCDE